jgi:hypothetical protein
LEKEASLRIDFEDPRESFLLKGKFTQAENVAYRKDMAIINLAFTEGQISMGYKMRINEYLATVRSSAAEGESPGKAAPAEGPAASPDPAALKQPAGEDLPAGGDVSAGGGGETAVKNLGDDAPARPGDGPALEAPAPKTAAGGKP